MVPDPSSPSTGCVRPKRVEWWSASSAAPRRRTMSRELSACAREQRGNHDRRRLRACDRRRPDRDDVSPRSFRDRRRRRPDAHASPRERRGAGVQAAGGATMSPATPPGSGRRGGAARRSARSAAWTFRRSIVRSPGSGSARSRPARTSPSSTPRSGDFAVPTKCLQQALGQIAKGCRGRVPGCRALRCRDGLGGTDEGASPGSASVPSRWLIQPSHSDQRARARRYSHRLRGARARAPGSRQAAPT